MSRQLLRPDGILGLCAIVFGEDDIAAESTSLDRLEHFSRVLSSAPVNIAENVLSWFINLSFKF